MHNKKDMLILFLFVLRAGDSMPQGFLSQGLSMPRFVSWNNEASNVLSILPGSLKINVFNKKINVDKKPKKEHAPNDEFRKVSEEFMKDLPQNDNFRIANENHRPLNVMSVTKTSEELNFEQSIPKLTPPKNITEQSNNIKDVKLPNDLNSWEQLISKFSGIDDTTSDKEIDANGVTTEVATDTTTEDYETTTFDYTLDNRASGQLVATLLG